MEFMWGLGKNSTRQKPSVDKGLRGVVWNVARRQLFPETRTANTDSGTAVSSLGIANTEVR